MYFSNSKPCLIGIEACGTSHFWARQLVTLGHETKGIPSSYMKPYVRRGKNDAADAEVICEAVTRPYMRFVPIKTEDQQAALMLRKARELLVHQQTMMVNALRAHMAELGMVAPLGRGEIKNIIAVIEDCEDESIHDLVKSALKPLVMQLRANEEALAMFDTEIKAWHKSNAASKRLATIPRVGYLMTPAIALTVPDPSFFKSGREFSAWLGLVPRQNSSGGKERLGRISKKGNSYIRRLLVLGSTSMLRCARTKATPGSNWDNGLLERRPPRLVTVAMANKTTRIAWALLAREETYQMPKAAA